MEEIQVVLYGKLVNVSKWASSHPGGKAIMKSFHNRDATDQFEAMHSQEAKKQLTNYFLPKSPSVSSAISALPSRPVVRSFSASSEESQRAIWSGPNSSIMDNGEYDLSKYEENQVSKDFVALKKTLEEKGLFKTNVLKESFVAFYTLSMYAVGAYLIIFTPHMYKGLFCMLQALYMSGWVAHDYLHHAVLPSVYWNEMIGDLFGMLQGYDKEWWKSRHNQHHVNTNECAHDPDISIAPLFHFVQQFPDLKMRLKHIQKYQHYYFLPFLTLLDVDWRYESIVRVMDCYHKTKLPALKLLVHYIVSFYIGYTVGFWNSVGLLLARGFLTAIVVFSSHYSEKRYNTAPTLSLVEQTAYTTRNISGGSLVNFFTGQISIQIEHHLFPTMPPANLHLSTPYVKQFFKEHNLPYYESSLLECTTRLLNSLNMHATSV